MGVLQGKIAVITGGNSGIGLAAAKAGRALRRCKLQQIFRQPVAHGRARTDAFPTVARLSNLRNKLDFDKLGWQCQSGLRRPRLPLRDGAFAADFWPDLPGLRALSPWS